MNEVEKYLNNLNKEQKMALVRIIKIIKVTVSGASEVMSYGMPVYKYKDKYLIGVAAFKNHMSIFPGAGLVEKFATELSNFKTAKGTIQFTTVSPIPESLISKIVRYRQRQIDDLIN